MKFRDDDAFKPDNIDEMNIVGPGDEKGSDIDITCKGCGHYLTTIKLNMHCVIDLRIECSKCGMRAEALNLWAEKVVK